MPPNESWGSDVAVVACSLQHDRAVVVRSTETPTGENPAAIWAVQLSTGRVISTLHVDTVNPGFGMIASADGTRLAYQPVIGEQPEKVPGPPGLPSRTMLVARTGDPRLVDLDTGRTIADLGKGGVLALNDDGSRVVTLGVTGRSTFGFRISDIATGRVVWSRGGTLGATGGQAVAELGTGSFIVETGTGNNGPLTLSLVLVDSGGRWREVPSGFAPGEVQYLANLGG
jgi:hypothetical protein